MKTETLIACVIIAIWIVAGVVTCVTGMINIIGFATVATMVIVGAITLPKL